jgi:hypothetical protein
MVNAPPIETIGEYETELERAIHDMERVVKQYPTDRALHAILDQLKMLQNWTSEGEPPTVDQKNQLNFGHIASRYLDDTDQDLAQRIYAIRRFIRYWNTPSP